MLCCSGKLLAISILLLRLASANNDAQPTITVSGDKPRRLSIAYYGASNSNVTDDYLSVLKTSGVTDAWVPYMAGAYAVDCCKKNEAAYKAGGLHAGLLSLADVKAQKLATTRKVIWRSDADGWKASEGPMPGRPPFSKREETQLVTLLETLFGS